MTLPAPGEILETFNVPLLYDIHLLSKMLD
jgi:hypothetical protein